MMLVKTIRCKTENEDITDPVKRTCRNFINFNFQQFSVSMNDNIEYLQVLIVIRIHIHIHTYLYRHIYARYRCILYIYIYIYIYIYVKFTSYQFKSTSSKIIKSMKTQVDSLPIFTRIKKQEVTLSILRHKGILNKYSCKNFC